MSIQHVFESARRLGLPVILTDIGGRDPMVVLPLDQFEAMAGESPVKPLAKPEPHQDVKRPEALHGLSAKDLEVLSKAAPAQDLPLDERFYLEPVDDDKS